jgi:hypothetical protein
MTHFLFIRVKLQVTVLEPKLINNIKQSHDHRVISIIPILVHENPPWLNAKTTFKSETK